MQTLALKNLVETTLNDLKAIDLTAIDLQGRSLMSDYLIICTGRSTRHVSAMAEKLVEAVKKNGIKPLGVDGKDRGEWVLIDLIDVVVHIMIADVRAFYDLESLWGSPDTA